MTNVNAGIYYVDGGDDNGQHTSDTEQNNDANFLSQHRNNDL